MTIGMCASEGYFNGPLRGRGELHLDATELAHGWGDCHEVEGEMFRYRETDLDTRPEQIGDDLSYCQIALVLRVVSHLR